ncbi:MAG: hypothetical protein IPK50_12815 [Fibrobacterota bacterium]|nr:MAG: hypothetical protein IPK50_12815 [Fibrobacterota bacterium]
MKKASLLLAAIGAGLALNACQDSPTEITSTIPSERFGRLSLRVDVGAVGVLARAATMSPSKLVLRFSAASATDVVDTIPLTATGLVVHDYPLIGGKIWTLSVTGFDGKDSVLHQGTETFRIGSDSTTNVRMSLDAKYSSFTMRFPSTDRTSRFFLGVDGATWCDTAPATVAGQKDTVKIQRDYLTSSRAGIPHAFSLKVSGNRGDKDTVLYALDTTLPVLSGESRNHRLALRWVGPLVPKNGQAKLEVTLGAVGQVDFEITYIEPGLACGEWKDESGFAWNPAISYGTLCDARDGQVYRTVVIGSQTWMAQNLNYAGSAQEGETGLCVSELPDYCKQYGRQYKDADMNRSDLSLCPRGWHVPDDAEWDRLVQIAGGSGRRLKSIDGWKSIENILSGGGPDSLGFRVLPAGKYHNTGYFPAPPQVSAGIWSSTGNAISFNYISVSFYDQIDVSKNSEGITFSIRCIED